MKSLFKTFLLLVSLPLLAQELNVPRLPFKIDTQDRSSLQRGARTYMNYCSGCHSLTFMRYNRMANQLGLTTFEGKIDEPLLVNNLVFTQAKIYDPIQIAMPNEDSRKWFGVSPPDLSLTARSRGPEWIYAYLSSFYEDSQRPFHSNNLIFPEVGMPDVLAPLRGRVLLLRQPEAQLIRLKSGSMTSAEFEQTLQDLVNFLVYVGEPVRDIRRQVGYVVLVFLAVFFMILFQLNRLYWKRVKSTSNVSTSFVATRIP